MPLSDFRSSFRSLLKHKVISSINILGLSIGISAALVIYLIVEYDYSFDRYEPNRDRLYRVVTHGDNYDNAGVPVPLPRALSAISGIERSAFMMGMNDNGTKVSIPNGNGKGMRLFKQQENFAYTDGNYFYIFPHAWLAGGPEVSLRDPHQLVLSESLIRRHFGDLPPDRVVGKTLMVDDSIPMVVSGVVRDLTAKSDFDIKAFVSMATIPASPGLKDQFRWDEWGSTNSINQVMLRLSPGVSAAVVQRQILRLFRSRNDHSQDKTTATLQPLSDIHFNLKLEGKVDETTLVYLSLLAVFILLLGAINFINLSTAQASDRAREIGMRKILGSSKGQLIARYLSETTLLTVIATAFSLLITPALIHWFSDFMPEGLDTYRLWQPNVLLFLAGLVVVVSFLSGIYPALVLTQIKPLSITRNQTTSAAGGNRRVWLRRTLTVSQFVIAQVLIIGVLVVNSQIRYATNKDMGFRKDAIVNFYLPFDFAHPDGKKFVLANKLRNVPEIQNVSLGNSAPAIGGYMNTHVEFKEGKNKLRLSVDSRDGDTNYIGLYNLRLIAGRNLMPADSPIEFLVNETLARDLGFAHPADAVGHMLSTGEEGYPIVGVLADFHLTSIRKPINPMIYTFDSKYGYVMHVALHRSPDTWKPAIAKMQHAWEEVYPDQPFTYTFFDKSILDFYAREQRLSKLLSWAAGVAILISCLGLLGLVIFTANQRTKEIGIRKVLGASVVQIITLLSKDFVRLVALAFVVAVPVTWYLAHKWLQSFAYQAGLSWWLFVVGGVSMLVIALVILSIRAGKAALANPTKSLRTE
jgi:predicted permease